MLKTSAKKRKSKFSSRLKAFSSFSDNFSTPTIKNGWKQNLGLWSLLNNNLVSTSNNAIISVPVSRSNAMVSINLPSGSSGVGPLFWYDGTNYWGSYLEVSQSTGPSTCNNGSCSGVENYTATRSCSCSSVTGTCQSSSYAVYGTCQQTTGTCSITGYTDNTVTCSSSTTTTYHNCQYAGSITSASYYVGDGNSCFAGGSQVSCSNCSGMCGSQGFICCRTETTSPYWDHPNCTYTGQQIPISSTTWNHPSCSYNGQTIVVSQTTNWNYAGCSSSGQTVVTGWNYGGCSSNGQQIYLGNATSWNYGGCSSNGQQVVIGQSSTCNNGSCSGTENYTATRSCSCSTITNRNIKTIKYENGVQTVIGTFSVSSNPTQIQIQTSGNNVTVSAGGNSATYTNLSSTKPKSFGILKTNGILEQGNSVSSFSVLAN